MLNAKYEKLGKPSVNIVSAHVLSVAKKRILSPTEAMPAMRIISIPNVSQEAKNALALQTVPKIIEALTKPLTDWQIIWAKFLSCLTLLVIALLPTLVYVITVILLGNPVGNLDMGSTWGSYLGLILLGAVYISIGLFSSSLSNNQIIAFIIAAALCFILSFGFAFIYSFDSLGAAGYYIKSLGIEHHYASISKGVIDSRDIIYFCSVVFLFLFGTRIVLLKRKW